jgi:hypothetical protein
MHRSIQQSTKQSNSHWLRPCMVGSLLISLPPFTYAFAIMQATTSMPSLSSIALEQLRASVHPRAAQCINDVEVDGGLAAAREVESLMRGEPAKGQVMFGGLLPDLIKQPAVTMSTDVATKTIYGQFFPLPFAEPPSDLLATEKEEWRIGTLNRVNAVFTENTQDEPWRLELRLDSPIFPEFWLRIVWTAADELSYARGGACRLLRSRASGRLSHSGSPVTAQLNIDTGCLEAESRVDDVHRVWVHYALPPEWLTKLKRIVA